MPAPTIDEKPKRQAARPLKRLRNIVENPHVAIIVDRHEADWTRLGWLLLRGRAEIIESGDEHLHTKTQLKDRYHQ